MALKKITYATEHKGVWACTDCPWESEETDFLRDPSRPIMYARSANSGRQPLTPPRRQPSIQVTNRMDVALKDRAWKQFEVAFNAAVVAFLALHWKSVLSWLRESVGILLEAIIPLLLLALLLLIFERHGDD
jgi:hypothetical protein